MWNRIKRIFNKKNMNMTNNNEKPKWNLIIARKNGCTFSISSQDEIPPKEFYDCVEWFVNDLSQYRRQPMWDGIGCVALNREEIELIYIIPNI